MPLRKGKRFIGQNIQEMLASGHPYRQALAAALRTAYGPRKKAARSRRQGFNLYRS